MAETADDTGGCSGVLVDATWQWRQRVIAARAAISSIRRRQRLAQRERYRLRGQITAWRADLAELEQSAEQAVADRDQELATALAGKIRACDRQLEVESGRLRLVERRVDRLERIRRAWQWRLEQHLRVASLRARASGRGGLTGRTTAGR